MPSDIIFRDEEVVVECEAVEIRQPGTDRDRRAFAPSYSGENGVLIINPDAEFRDGVRIDGPVRAGRLDVERFASTSFQFTGPVVRAAQYGLYRLASRPEGGSRPAPVEMIRIVPSPGHTPSSAEAFDVSVFRHAVRCEYVQFLRAPRGAAPPLEGAFAFTDGYDHLRGYRIDDDLQAGRTTPILEVLDPLLSELYGVTICFWIDPLIETVDPARPGDFAPVRNPRMVRRLYRNPDRMSILHAPGVFDIGLARAGDSWSDRKHPVLYLESAELGNHRWPGDESRFLPPRVGDDLARSQVDGRLNEAKLWGSNWYHVALVVRGRRVHVYRDGTKLQEDLHVPRRTAHESAWNGPVLGYGRLASELIVGGGARDGDRFIGGIGGVRIYNRDLSAEEIRSVYEPGLIGSARSAHSSVGAEEGDPRNFADQSVHGNRWWEEGLGDDDGSSSVPFRPVPRW